MTIDHWFNLAGHGNALVQHGDGPGSPGMNPWLVGSTKDQCFEVDVKQHGGTMVSMNNDHSWLPMMNPMSIFGWASNIFACRGCRFEELIGINELNRRKILEIYGHNQTYTDRGGLLLVCV